MIYVNHTIRLKSWVWIPLLPSCHTSTEKASQRLFFSKGKLVVICTRAHVIMQGMVQPKEEILILTFCCSQLPAPWRCAWSQDRCEKVPESGYRRERWENCMFSKAQQFHRKKTQLRIQILLLFHWSVLHLTGNNKWLYKTFLIHRGNSEILSCLKIFKS